MKTIGARTGQIAGLYVGAGGGRGRRSPSLVASAAGRRRAHGPSRAMVAEMLNFTLTSVAMPWWVFARPGRGGGARAAAGRGDSDRAREPHHGAGGHRPARRRTGHRCGRRFCLAAARPLRNALRRPARFALTLGLLAAGGAMFMTRAERVAQAGSATSTRSTRARHYDVEIRFHSPQPAALAERLRQVPGRAHGRVLGLQPGRASRDPGEIDVVRTYPDRGHGSFAADGAAPATRADPVPAQGRALASARRHARRWCSTTRRWRRRRGRAVGGQVHAVPRRAADALARGRHRRGDRARRRRLRHRRGLRASDGHGRPGAHAAHRHRSRARPRSARRSSARSSGTLEAARASGVEAVIPLSELRTAMGDHVAILIRMLIGDGAGHGRRRHARAGLDHGDQRAGADARVRRHEDHRRDAAARRCG